MRDFEADIRYGVRTMTVRIGYSRAVLVYCLLLVLAYATPVLLAREGLFPHLWYVYLALPFGVPPFLLMGQPYQKRHMIVPAVMLHHLAYGTFFCLSYFASARA